MSVVSRRWRKDTRVPPELEAELARTSAMAHEAWVAARRANDFASFAPYLERNFALAREYVDCFDTFDCAYDALLDDYEPGMKSAEVKGLFAEMRSALVPIIATVGEIPVDTSLVNGHFPVGAQRELVRGIVDLMGFDPAGWRLDDAAHPFESAIGAGDVRITTRWNERYLPQAIYGAMHECGHGLYEDGIAPQLKRTPLGHGTSLGTHESQSRLWENMVGRGRPFCDVLAPRIAGAFGDGADRAGGAVPRGQPRPSVADPGGGRRGDLRAAHRAAVRARAGAGGEPARRG